jgi:hypothetical protein
MMHAHRRVRVAYTRVYTFVVVVCMSNTSNLYIVDTLRALECTNTEIHYTRSPTLSYPTIWCNCLMTERILCSLCLVAYRRPLARCRTAIIGGGGIKQYPGWRYFLCVCLYCNILRPYSPTFCPLPVCPAYTLCVNQGWKRLHNTPLTEWKRAGIRPGTICVVCMNSAFCQLKKNTIAVCLSAPVCNSGSWATGGFSRS